MRYAILLAPLLAAAIVACGETDQAPSATEPTGAATQQPTATTGETQPGKLAFTSCTRAIDGSGSCDIYTVAADGSGLMRAIDGGRYAVWSPDGSRFAFAGDDGQISVAEADGSGVLRLAEGGDAISPPAWSPDGARILFVRGQDNLAVVAADGSAPAAYIENPAFEYYFITPAWSPDGARIVLQLTTQTPFDIELYLINPDFSGLVRLTDMEQTPSFPTWSPDGSRIAFGAEDIYAVNVDGSGLSALTSGAAEDNYPAWSPDGSRIAFSSCATLEGGESCGVSVVVGDGSGEERIADIAGTFTTIPAWSPDGAHVAFVSCEGADETLACAIYAVNADGSGLTLIAEAPAGERIVTVAWSPETPEQPD